jgi:hypothetical protein
MFQKLITLLLLSVFLLSACAAPAGAVIDTPGPDAPATNQPGDQQNPIEPGWLPAPGDENLTRGDVILEWADILTLESFPPQFMLNLRGNLRSGCDQLRVDVSPPDANNRVVVSVYSVRDPNQMCTEALVPFDVNVHLKTGAPGPHQVVVNGEPVGEFMVPDLNAGEKPVEEITMERGNAFIENSSIEATGTVPVLYLSGFLPTPCHQLKVDVKQDETSGEVQVEVYSLVDPSVMCIQVTEPFDTQVELPVASAAGYQVTLNGEVIGEVAP